MALLARHRQRVKLVSMLASAMVATVLMIFSAGAGLFQSP